MSATAPPELPETTPPTVKPTWLWALCIAAAFGAFQFTQAELGRGSGHRVGFALGNAVMPLLAAWFGTLIIKKPHVPTIVSGVVVAFLLTTGSATRGAIERARREFDAVIAERTATWAEAGKAWQDSGGCDPAIIQHQEKLRSNLSLALERMESTRSLLGDWESGELLFAKLAEAGVSNADSEAAWAHVQAGEDYQVALGVLRGTDGLLRAAGIYLSELDHKFGRWHVDAATGSLVFDGDVPEAIIKRVNDAVVEMQACREQVEKVSARQR